MTNQASKVLVVDDDRRFGAALASQLEELGCSATTATSAEEALVLVRERSFDLVMLDLVMPRFNGHALIRALHSTGHDQPIVAMSGRGSRCDLIGLIREGAADFLQKPFDEHALSETLDRVLPKRARSGPPAQISSYRQRQAERARPDPEADTSDGRAMPAPAAFMAEIARMIGDGTADLPVIAPIASDVRRLMGDPTCSVEDVVSVVEQDPRTVATLIRASNSSYYRAGSPITSPRAACLRLGNRRVLAIAQQAVVSSAYDLGRGPVRRCIQDMWRNVVVTSRGAYKLAVEVGDLDPDEVQVAALFHNIGEVALLRAAVEKSPESFEVREFLASLVPEIARLHEHVGRLVLRRWQMEPQQADLAGSHHKRPSVPTTRQHERLRCVVVAAWIGACRAGFTYLPGQRSLDATEVLERLERREAWLDQQFLGAGDWIERGRAGSR